MLFVAIMFEVVAIVLVTAVVADYFDSLWQQLLWAALPMVLVSYILLGVGARTLGRQHADALALRTAGLVTGLTTVLGWFPGAHHPGQLDHPGRGFVDGPFTSEAELRELVDMAEASEVIEAGERRMIHQVFELGDTIVKGGHGPRTEMVWIEADKTLRQGLSLALRSGFSRIPVVGDDIDDVRGVLYLKDVIRRSYDNPQAQASRPWPRSCAPPPSARTPSRWTPCSRRCSSPAATS